MIYRVPHFKDAASSADIADDGSIVAGYATMLDREPDSYGDMIAPGMG